MSLTVSTNPSISEIVVIFTGNLKIFFCCKMNQLIKRINAGPWRSGSNTFRNDELKTGNKVFYELQQMTSYDSHFNGEDESVHKQCHSAIVFLFSLIWRFREIFWKIFIRRHKSKLAISDFVGLSTLWFMIEAQMSSTSWSRQTDLFTNCNYTRLHTKKPR